MSLGLYRFDAAQSAVEDFALGWPCTFPSWNWKTYRFPKLVCALAELFDIIFQIDCDGKVPKGLLQIQIRDF